MSSDHRPGGESRPANSRQRAQRSPRRKAERKVAFKIVVEAQEMLITYEPNWSDGEFAVGHFEFRSPHEPPRRIPVSETGYLSHFATMADIKACQTPENYARMFVVAVLDRAGKGKSRTTGSGQLSLF